MSSNVSLSLEVYRFLKKSLISRGYNGYFDIDWAGCAGSGREFYRIFVGKKITLILMVWDGSDPDWDYFLEMKDLKFSETVIPKVFTFDRELGAIVLEDAGFRQLKDLFRGIYTLKEKKNVLKQVFEKLLIYKSVDITEAHLVNGRCYDFEHALWESTYFKEHVQSYFPELASLFDEKWDREVHQLAKGVSELAGSLMHRDFQSENILVKNEEISFVDFQGSRIGPVEYDIASLLYDPYIYTAMGDEVRIELLTHCCFLFKVNLNDIKCAAMQRLLQAIGAYCNLSKNKGKKR